MGDSLLSNTDTALLTSVILGSLLLLTGILVGCALSRLFTRREPKSGADRQQTLRLMEELSRWTSHVSTDVNEYREMIEDFSRQVSDKANSAHTPTTVETAGLLGQMLEANRRLQRRLDTAEATLRQQADELAAYMSEARTDALTRLNNRRVFDEALASSLTAWRTQGKAVAVLLLDIDHFKRLNDTYGHLAGDAMLQGLAKVLRDTKPAGSVTARYGGEEFALVLHQFDLPGACAAAYEILQAVANLELIYEGRSIRSTISCGVALAAFGEDGTSLVKRCDEALYAAKSAGRNSICYHDGYRTVSFQPAASAEQQQLTKEEQMALDFQDVCRDLRSRLQQVALAE
ncbi:MAG TPA: GGDEF domain-containing protein [Pirellulaceae bacterium]|nr:GGDEF domain-containing protein [Pirellulaceae bacterium]